MRNLRPVIANFTLAFLAGYAPIETYITWSIAHSLLVFGYLINVVGMALMFWGAVAAKNRRPHGAGVLAVGWSWTASLFWRATNDRFWAVDHGYPLFAGPIELLLAPALTILTLIALVGSLVLLLRNHEDVEAGSK